MTNPQFYGTLRPFGRIAAALLTLLLGLCLTACGARPIPAPDDALTSADDVLRASLARLDAIDTGRIRSRTTYYGGGARARVRQAVVFAAPDSVRIETISPMDTTLSVLVLGSGTVTMYDLGAQLFVQGEATPQNLARLAPVPLTADDVVRVLSGAPPLDMASEASLEQVTLRWNTRRGAYTLTLPTDEGGELELDIRHGDWVVSGARWRDADGEPVWDYAGAMFETLDGSDVVMPHRLRFRIPAERVDVELEVERYDLNPSLADTLFTLTPPRGVEVTPL